MFEHVLTTSAFVNEKKKDYYRIIYCVCFWTFYDIQRFVLLCIFHLNVPKEDIVIVKTCSGNLNGIVAPTSKSNS